MISRLKSKLGMIKKDATLREVAQGVFVTFGLKVLGAALTFGFNVLVARLLGVEGAGLYFMAFSITVIGSVVGRLGLNNALVRFIASHAAKNQWIEVNGVHDLGLKMAFAASFLLSISMFLFADWAASNVFQEADLADPLRWMSLAILPYSLVVLNASSLKGIKKFRDAMFVDGVGVPFIAILIVVPLAQMAGVVGVAWSYLVAMTIVAIIGIRAWNRSSQKAEQKDSVKYPAKALWESCKPLMAVSLMSAAIIPWSPIFLLGIWKGADEVGLYGAATRLAMLVSFVLIAANSVLSSKFAELYAKGELEAMASLARRAAAILSILVSPVFVLLVFYNEEMMTLYGAEFAAGGSMLAILLLGQGVNVLTGSVNSILMMTGNEKAVKNIAIVSGGLQIAFLLVLIPLWGGIGAAIATSTTIVVMNAAAAIAIRKRLGILTVPFICRKC